MAKYEGEVAMTWEERQARLADARRRREEYWRERKVIEKRYREGLREIAATTRAALASTVVLPSGELTFEERQNELDLDPGRGDAQSRGAAPRQRRPRRPKGS